MNFPWYQAGWQWQVSVPMTAQVIDGFARMSGDHNPLHVDEIEARLYAYRRRVVHGILPISLLSLSPLFISGEGRLRSISGRFVRPVFLGDTVTLILRFLGILEGKGISFSYEIQGSFLKEKVTYGEFIWQDDKLKKTEKEGTGTFVSCPVSVNGIEFEDIALGMSESLTFSTGIHGWKEWHQIIHRATGDECISQTDFHFSPELTVAVLCSTLIGMRLPGRWATFLDFFLDFERPVLDGETHSLKGSVDFISVSTRMVILMLEVGGISRIAQGRATVKMDEPSKKLLGMEELLSAEQSHFLKGKTVLITGASRGIGATTARLFASRGANVVINYLSREKDARAVMDDINGHGGRAIIYQADVSRRDEVKAMVAHAVQIFGTIDVLVNNAVGDFLPVAFQALTWEKVQRELDIVLQGAFNCAQEVVPLMLKKKGGRIINIGTIASEVPPVAQMKYVIAKSALIGFTRGLAVELAAQGVLVNMVVPSMVETDLTKSVPPAVRDQIRVSNPLGRHPQAIEVARAVVMLAGEDASYTTGQKFFVTGGLPPLC